MGGIVYSVVWLEVPKARDECLESAQLGGGRLNFWSYTWEKGIEVLSHHFSCPEFLC